ncbi:formate/nitrite transporter family protein [Spiroplasma sp. DGKH1]|uniref:formate/nitrite transporter family protein n=1 Tax=Spiroplasma sp. DGKH1 TaxID=3050074 RepID=UPI0034C627C4
MDKKLTQIVKYQQQLTKLSTVDLSILDEHHSYSEQAIIGAFEASNKKINASVMNTIINGILGGLFISLGYIVALFAMQGVTTTGVKQLIFGITFPIGLILVTFLGGGLYTSHCVGFINSSIGAASPWKFYRNLMLVFLGNFLGSLLAAVVIYFAVVYGHILTGDKAVTLNTHGDSWSAETMQMIEHKMGFVGSALAEGLTPTGQQIGQTFLNNLMSGIYCNILVGATLYLTYSSKNAAASFLGIFLALFAFCVAGFQHVVANTFIFWMNIFMVGDQLSATHVLPASSVGYFVLVNLIPAFIGNFIGGGLLIPVLCYFIARKKINAVAVKGQKKYFSEQIKLLQLKTGFAQIINHEFVLDETKFNQAIQNLDSKPHRQWFKRRQK